MNVIRKKGLPLHNSEVGSSTSWSGRLWQAVLKQPNAWLYMIELGRIWDSATSWIDMAKHPLSRNAICFSNQPSGVDWHACHSQVYHFAPGSHPSGLFPYGYSKFDSMVVAVPRVQHYLCLSHNQICPYKHVYNKELIQPALDTILKRLSV